MDNYQYMAGLWIVDEGLILKTTLAVPTPGTFSRALRTAQRPSCRWRGIWSP